MNDRFPSPHERWRVANLIWIVVGFLFPLVSLVTVALANASLPFLISAGSFSNELLAYRVAVTLVRMPLSALFGILAAVTQLAAMPDLRSLARRWWIAAAVGAMVSTLILLPSSLVFRGLAGNPSVEMIRTYTELVGAPLFGGFVSLSQRITARRRLAVPASFVATGVLGALAGAFATVVLASAFGH